MKNRKKPRRDTHQRGTEKTISYRNGEGYSDPTAYAAVKNIVKKQPRN